MKLVLIILLSLQNVLFSLQAAEPCDFAKCLISTNCRCSTTQSPLPTDSTPQFISLTFEEALPKNLYVDLWQPLLSNRKNPDGNPISGTFYVPHEYSDYTSVHDLYVQGFEIAANSVTNNALAEYWAQATQQILRQEFGDQRTIISHFANIPIEEVIGARVPQLKTEGDTLINAYVAAGIQYDGSWTTRSNYPLFPYTLDYLSSQECRSDTICPIQSHPGFWIAPVINILGNQSVECNALTNCNYYGTPDEIASWLFREIQRVRLSRRAPLALIVPSAWFRFIPNSYEGFGKFLDMLSEFNDIFLVSQKQVIDWIKNPIPLGEFKTDTPQRTKNCPGYTCELRTTNGDIRYMSGCARCPAVYPWLGNPLGELTK